MLFQVLGPRKSIVFWEKLVAASGVARFCDCFGLMPLGNTPLPEPMYTLIYIYIYISLWQLQGHNELNEDPELWGIIARGHQRRTATGLCLILPVTHCRLAWKVSDWCPPHLTCARAPVVIPHRKRMMSVTSPDSALHYWRAVAGPKRWKDAVVLTSEVVLHAEEGQVD